MPLRIAIPSPTSRLYPVGEVGAGELGVSVRKTEEGADGQLTLFHSAAFGDVLSQRFLGGRGRNTAGDRWHSAVPDLRPDQPAALSVPPHRCGCSR
jgi:hypothetical protein